jgi:hypothetical protein
MNCDVYDGGCDGGHVSTAYRHIKDSGIDTMNCTAYYSGSTGAAGNCTSQCDDPSQPYVLYYTDSWKELVNWADQNQTIENMKQVSEKNNQICNINRKFTRMDLYLLLSVSCWTSVHSFLSTETVSIVTSMVTVEVYIV